MKKALIAIGSLAVILAVTLVWLAGSVGPDTAPGELKTRELPNPVSS